MPTRQLALARVDNRLVHGQVLEAWLPALEADAILVADDEAAADPFARAAMQLAIPEDVSFSVLSLDAAAARLAGEGPPGSRTLLLLREVEDAARLVEKGAALSALNLGNVHFRPGRAQVTGSVHLDRAELGRLEALQARGVAIDLRAVPGEKALGLDAVRHALR